MSVGVILGLALGYVTALFVLAGWVERRRDRFARPLFRRPAYMLALGVYCTSWTFFGAVGTAAADGWSFLPITLGPALVWLLAPQLVSRLVAVVQRDGSTSIADFIGSRFGKSRGVSALVTLLALFGLVPYLALQLRSVGTSIGVLTGGSPFFPTIATAVVLVLFAVLFGTRRYSASGRSEAVLYAVAIESLVKLFALSAVALFAIVQFLSVPLSVQEAGMQRMAARFDPSQIGSNFIVITLLAMVAIICLPRQFYIGVIEADGPDDARAARWPFIAYLTVTTLAVLPVTLAGLTLLPAGHAPDLYVLDLPLAAGANGMVIVVFLGGFAAATGMAVVESIALSTMVSNDLIGPVLLPRLAPESDVGRIMLRVRRLVIVAVMGVALAYALSLAPGARLADIGLVAFAAIAQFAPVLLLALRDRVGDARAAIAGLATGLALWTFLLLLPAIGWLERVDLASGVIFSLGGNITAYGIVAARRLRTVPSDVFASEVAARVVTLGALSDMATRFVGESAVAEVIGSDRHRDAPVDRHAAQAIERLIAGVVGGPSARVMMASALSGTSLRVDDVARMLDASGQSLQFSKGLLAATLENIDPGVSVVDRNLRLVAWNSRYLDLFRYPPGLVKVGASVADLIRYNAMRGECGPGEVEDHVARRLEHMRRASPHSFERVRPDGRVIKTVGGPMTGGGYVMCFTDISAEAEARAELERARAELEVRVDARTRELQVANAALGRATEDKTRFLAAASHDLLQPLHAARLFAAALGSEVSPAARPILANVDRSIAAADALLRALLDISKLDAGGIRPVPTRFLLRGLLAELVESFAPLAAEKQLTLRLGPGDGWVETDRSLLRSVVQNFLSNAVRYTVEGGIVVGVRRRGGHLRIDVYDTGTGIAAIDQKRIFIEFERLASAGEAGIGLGLAIARRTAVLLGTEIELLSEPGRGSRFSITLPQIRPEPSPRAASASPRRTTEMAGTRVLIVDDDLAIRDATAALLATWDCRSIVAATGAAALDLVEHADRAIVDLDLRGEEDGISLIGRLKAVRPGLVCALITADRSLEIAARCAGSGVTLFVKPVDPVKLADWLVNQGDPSAP